MFYLINSKIVLLDAKQKFIEYLLQISIQLDLLEKWLPPSEADEGIGGEETVTNFKLALDPSSPSENCLSEDVSLSRYYSS